MKTALAIIVALFFFLFGWFILASLLYGVMYLASRARDGMGIMHLLNVLLVWILSPGFGGFLATYITPRIFRQIDVLTIFTSFTSVVVTIAIFMALFSIFFSQKDIGNLILLVVQYSAVVLGAKIGKSIYSINSA